MSPPTSLLAYDLGSDVSLRHGCRRQKSGISGLSMYSWHHEIIESDLFFTFKRMTREEKIEAIYSEMANKKVSFGCRYEHNGSVYTVDSGNYRLMQHGDSYYLYIDAHCNCPIKIVELYNDFSSQGVVKIIGHPVMLGTIFERYSASKGFINSQFILALVDKWTGYDKPIEEQSDECIDFVHSLIKKS